MIIYKITNSINNKIYIGQTKTTLLERFNNHIACMRRGDNRKLYCAMRKYGINNFNVEQIDSANSIEELNQKEAYWIKFYNSVEKGYNMTYSVENPMNYSNIVEKHNNKMRTKDVREKISKSLSNYRKLHGFSSEHLEKISNALKGNKNFQGHKRSEYAKQKARESIIKPVYCIDKENRVVEKFNSVKDAAIWWYDYDKFNLKYKENLCDYIKSSSVNNKYIRSLKWIYGCPCVETIERVALD